MKHFFLGLFLFCSGISTCLSQGTKSHDAVDFVNPLIGSDSKFDMSNGNTYPAIALPWGMNFWTPQTNKMGDGWCYQYASNKIRGFKQTHQPSPWVNDYGVFSIFATTEKLVFKDNERESWYSHKAEVSKPYYYKAYLADYNTTVEITPTERAARFRITYPKTDKAYLIVDAFFKKSFVKVYKNERKIVGYSCNNSGGVPENFKNYFVVYADKDFEEIFIAKDGAITENDTEATGKHVGSIIRFKTKEGEAVNLKIASSFISAEQAELNLQREIGTNTFDEIRDKGHDTWNTMMSRVKVEGGTDDQMSTFYTALYRTMLFPRRFFEFDKSNKAIHYSPYNGKIYDGYMFTDNGFWDTFRAVFPFFTLMFPEINSQMMKGLVNTYKESGWLPEWASPGHRMVMVGSNSASIIADSYLKGIRGYDINTLFEAIIKNSENEGPIFSVGRLGVKDYNSIGYVPVDARGYENTSRSIEYSYDDFTIWRLAKLLNKPQSVIDTFYKRAHYYENSFDKSVNFMRGRKKDGSFLTPFRPDSWGKAFSEGCAWHWTWCVFHDVEGLKNLMGGRDEFIKKMDSVFTVAPTVEYSAYGSLIHEMVEMQIANMGQYAHGNQPIQHMPYLYNFAGEPWKTQFRVRDIMDKLYLNAPDGLCGDEDNGQTSAWYVFSALGFYPVCPGSNQYVLGAPLFKKATLMFENGNKLTINAPDNSVKNFYINSLKRNKTPYTKNYFDHFDLIKGGTIDIQMSDKPNKKRGINAADFPYSMSAQTN